MHPRGVARYTALVGVVTAVLVSSMVACGKRDEVSSAKARTALSGEVVFRGLVFHEGAVAALIPEAGIHVPSRKLTPEQRNAGERVKAQLMADIRQANPTFFDRFGVEIQSGNPLRIEQAMHESAMLVKQVNQKRAPAAPTPVGLHAMTVDNTYTDNSDVDNNESYNTDFNNKDSGNLYFANSFLGNSVIGNSYINNTSYNNTQYNHTADGTNVSNTDNTDVDTYDTDGDDTDGDSTDGDSTDAYDTDVDNDGESAWAGARTRLGHDQLVEMISTRLATE